MPGPDCARRTSESAIADAKFLFSNNISRTWYLKVLKCWTLGTGFTVFMKTHLLPNWFFITTHGEPQVGGSGRSKAFRVLGNPWKSPRREVPCAILLTSRKAFAGNSHQIAESHMLLQYKSILKTTAPSKGLIHVQPNPHPYTCVFITCPPASTVKMRVLQR